MDPEGAATRTPIQEVLEENTGRRRGSEMPARTRLSFRVLCKFCSRHGLGIDGVAHTSFLVLSHGTFLVIQHPQNPGTCSLIRLSSKQESGLTWPQHVLVPSVSVCCWRRSLAASACVCHAGSHASMSLLLLSFLLISMIAKD